VLYTVNAYGAAYVDVTTGSFYMTEFDTENKLLDEISKISPSEIICNFKGRTQGVFKFNI